MGQAGEKLTQSKSFSLEKIFVTCWHVLIMRKRLGMLEGGTQEGWGFYKDGADNDVYNDNDNDKNSDGNYDTRAFGATGEQPSKSEYNGALILLNNLVM